MTLNHTSCCGTHNRFICSHALLLQEQEAFVEKQKTHAMVTTALASARRGKLEEIEKQLQMLRKYKEYMPEEEYDEQVAALMAALPKPETYDAYTKTNELVVLKEEGVEEEERRREKASPKKKRRVAWPQQVPPSLEVLPRLWALSNARSRARRRPRRATRYMMSSLSSPLLLMMNRLLLIFLMRNLKRAAEGLCSIFICRTIVCVVLTLDIFVSSKAFDTYISGASCAISTSYEHRRVSQ